MKFTKLAHTIALGTLLAGLSGFSLSALAVGDPAGTTPGTTETTEIETEDDGFDWGWLGLLGLAGLLGLRGKDRDRDTHYTTTAQYRDPNETTRSL